MDLITRFFGHDRWTTHRVLDLSSDLTEEQLDQEFDIGRGTLRETCNHMITAMDVWAMLMAGQWSTPNRVSTSVDILKSRLDRAYDAFENVSRKVIADNRLDEIFLDHHGYPQSYGGTIAQVILHNQQHRSEILHILKRLGVPDLPDGDLQEWEHITNALPGINPE
jgi:uncharacterized damage-inducible protein DinB